MPIDIANDGYCHYSTHFYDIGVLDNILEALHDSPTISQAASSTTLDTFITDMALPRDQPLFVIYVYTEVFLARSSTFH
jgi:hypothetical protein